MSIINAQFTLGTAATQITKPSVMVQTVILHNMTKSNNNYIYYGGPTVGTATAPHIDPGETLQVTLLPLQVLYAVSDPANLPVGVLQVQA